MNALVEVADIEKSTYKFIYKSGSNYSFMHPDTFEEIQLSRSDIDDSEFLLDGEDMEVTLMFFNGKVIGTKKILNHAIDYSFNFPFRGRTSQQI